MAEYIDKEAIKVAEAIGLRGEVRLVTDENGHRFLISGKQGEVMQMIDYDRLHRYGWPVERAFTEPVRRTL